MLAGLRQDIGRDERSLLSLSRQLAQNPRDPLIKLFVVWRVLQLRRQHPDLFQFGDYLPLEVGGPQAKHVCAFARACPSGSGSGRKVAIAIAPCRIAELTPLTGDALALPPLGSAVWADTYVALGDVASSSLTNLFTGQVFAPEDSRIPLAAALADFPVAVMTGCV